MDRRAVVKEIQARCADAYGVKLADLRGPRKIECFAAARRMAMFIARAVTGESFPKLGQLFGGRDHSTVVHACNRFAELAKVDPTLRERAERIVEHLNLEPRRRVTDGIMQTKSPPPPDIIMKQLADVSRRLEGERAHGSTRERRIIANEGRDDEGDLVIRQGYPHPSSRRAT